MKDLWRQRKKLSKKEKDYCISFYYSIISFVTLVSLLYKEIQRLIINVRTRCKTPKVCVCGNLALGENVQVVCVRVEMMAKPYSNNIVL